MKKILIVSIIVFLICGCAGQNELTNIPNAEQHLAGFLNGLWHGIISPISFIISLFDNSVGIYEVHNNGNFYNLGFLIGIGGFTGTASSKSKS